MLYRPFQSADLPGVAAIRAREWESQQYWEERIAGYLAGRRNPQYALAPRACFVAEENGQITGFAAGHLTTRYSCQGELEWINVLPEHRSRGIASALLRSLAGWFAEQGAHRVCVDVDPTNTVARAFYEKHGAEPLNRHWLVWTAIRMLSP